MAEKLKRKKEGEGCTLLTLHTKQMPGLANIILVLYYLFI